jgi:succinate dehydrogenase / fumarate reductase cytochrome b subunit
MAFALFKGSRVNDNAPEVLKATLAISKKLGIELIDIEEFSSSGEGHLEDYNEFVSTLVNARNLAYAEAKKLKIVTLSNLDFITLKETKAKLDIDSNLKTRVNEELKKISLSYSGKTDVVKFIDLLPKISPAKTLEEFSIASYIGEDGCDTSNIIKSLGAKVIDFPLATSPCGVSIIIRNKSLATKLSGKILVDAVDNSANAIVVNCANQYINLDLYQCSSAYQTGRDDINIPIFYISQIIGLALDIPAKELGLNQNIAEVSI